MARLLRGILMVGVGMLLLSPPRLTTASAPPTLIRLVSSTPEAVVLVFTLPDYTLQKVSTQGQVFVRPQVAGLVPAAEPGAPQLPQTGVLIGLPLTGTPDLRILEAEQERVPLTGPVYPAPSAVPAPYWTRYNVRTKAGALPAGPAYEFALDETIYARDAFYPADAVSVSVTGWLRDHRVARVTFHPLRYNPVRRELEVTQRLVVEIRFNGSRDASATEASGAPSPAFEAVLLEALFNYETARDWRASPRQPMNVVALNAPATQAGSYKIFVDADGLYQLAYADLQAAGLPVEGLDPRTFQVFEGGQEIAIQVGGQDDGVFDEDDSLLFYGRAPHSRYTAHNVYWLRYGETTGLRVESRDVTPGTVPFVLGPKDPGLDTVQCQQQAGTAWATARYEENVYYDSTLPAADGDHWYAADVRPGADQTATLGLVPPAMGAPTATLRVRMVGYTVSSTHDPDHQATFAVNGDEVGQLGWDGVSPVTATVVLDQAILQAGDNLVTISAGVSYEGIWLDTVELAYPCQAVVGDEAVFWGQAEEHWYELGGFTGSDISLYDVTEPQRPVLLQGAEVTGSGSIVPCPTLGPLAPGQRVRCYALSFADVPTQPVTYLALMETRLRQPVSIVADTPSNLCDDADGADYLIITHDDFAEAVQPLAAHRQAQDKAVVVADVQDVYDEFSGGLLDPEAIRDFVAYVMPSFVLLVGDGSYDFLDHYGYGSANYIPPYLAMVDDWWGETAADNRFAAVNGDDPLPDVMLGRLPVSTPAEATTVVQKILDYEQSPWLGDWNARHVFVAAEYDHDLGEAGNFAAAADAVHDAFVNDPWVGRKIYVDDLSAETARQETLNDWQQGALLVSFLGHSSWHQWAASRLPPVQSLLDIHDVPNLRNDRRWPVVLSMTCFTGFFHHPEYGTLDESLLRLDGGGAVATWSPSGLGVATGHNYLHQGFYQAVFGGGQTELGPAVLAAKLALYSHTQVYNDLLETYHLFGDPAMALNLTIRPWPYSTFLPIAGKNHSGG